MQGGGCMTVGVAGIILGGGFGSFSKAYGTAAANLIEAEVVTANGEVIIANACSNPDLFWALKGGGGGFGVVTRVTVRTHPLPEFFGAVFAAVKATSDDAYRRLIAKIVEFYREALFNPHWGEQILIGRGFVGIQTAMQGLDQQQAEAAGFPSSTGNGFPAGLCYDRPRNRRLPGADLLGPGNAAELPVDVVADDRPGAPLDNIFWAGPSAKQARSVRVPIRLAPPLFSSTPIGAKAS